MTRTLHTPGFRRGGGFALIVALVLMAFLLLLLVSLSTLVQTELGAASHMVTQARARKNAELGLLVALGQLQTYLAADKRSTARADLVFADDALFSGSAYWVGSWHNDPADPDYAQHGKEPRWLVSGKSANPGNAPESGVTMLKVPAGGGAPDVVVGKQAIAQEGGRASGHFAYWVSDESLKAMVTATDESDKLLEAIAWDKFSDVLNTAEPETVLPEADQAGREAELEQVLQKRTLYGRGLKGVHSGFDPLSTPAKQLSGLLDFGSVTYIDAFSGGVAAEALWQRYHDLTLYSYGVLSDPQSGGLKKNITDPDYTDALITADVRKVLDVRVWDWEFEDAYEKQSFFTVGAYPQEGIFVHPAPNNPNRHSPLLKAGGKHSVGAGDGEVLIHYYPLLTELMVTGRFLHNSSALEPVSSGKHVPFQNFNYHVAYNFWNPFTHAMEIGREPLRWNNAAVPNVAYYFAFHGLPRVGIHPVDTLGVERVPPLLKDAATGNGNDLATQRLNLDMNYFQKTIWVDGFQRHGKLRADVMVNGFNDARIASSASLGSSILYPGEVYKSISPRINSANESDYGKTGSARYRLTGGNLAGYDNIWAYRPHEVNGHVTWDRGQIRFEYDEHYAFRIVTLDGNTPNGNLTYLVDIELYPAYAHKPADAKSFVPWSDSRIPLVSHNPLEPVLVLKNIPFDGWDMTIPAEEYAYIQDKDYLPGEHHLAWWLRLKSDAQTLRTFLNYMNRQDPRKIVLDFEGSWTSEVGSMFEGVSDPADVTASSVAFSGSSLFYDDRNDSHLPATTGADGYNRVTLFDLPVVLPVDLGVFREMQFKNRPVHYVGSPAATDKNVIFNRYFFTGVPEQGWSVRTGDGRPAPLPNVHLVGSGTGAATDAELLATYRDSTKAAQSLLVRGAFNINSTSYRSWLALLKQSMLVTLEEGEQQLENVFFAQPHDSGRLADAESLEARILYPAHPASADADYYSRNIRVFSDEELENLAKAIVRALRLRDAPFTSVGELADSGLIEQALADSGINTGIPSLAPVYIDQAKLLGRLSPLLQPRGDTFVIRSYGDELSPVDPDKIVASAMCEAVVQRLPESVDGSSANRAFKIISFRWLDHDGN